MKGFFFLSKGEEKELAESYLIPQSRIFRALKQDTFTGAVPLLYFWEV